MRFYRGAVVLCQRNTLDTHRKLELAVWALLNARDGAEFHLLQVCWWLRWLKWLPLGWQGVAACPLSPCSTRTARKGRCTVWWVLCSAESTSLAPVGMCPYLVCNCKRALTNLHTGDGLLQTECCSPLHPGRFWKGSLCCVSYYPDANKETEEMSHQQKRNTDTQGHLLHKPFQWQTLSYTITGQCLCSSLGK